ncbi:MAG: exopolysaccharide biosynthesis protein [Bacteriovoracia bacterium]
MKESLFIHEMDRLRDDGIVTLGEMADKLRNKGLVFVSLLCILPFMQPIPIPGLSSVLGFVILLQGVGLVLSGKPLLTKRMRHIEFPVAKMETFIRGARKVYPWIGWMIKPRGQALTKHRAVEVVAGVVLVGLALFLSLPLPLPSSNFIPAIGIFFICLGLLEEDLLLVLLGISYALIFGWVLSFSFHLLWDELSNSSWWGRYF